MRTRPLQSLLTALLLIFLPSTKSAGEQADGIDATITFFYYEDIEAQRPFYEGLLGLEKTMDEDWVKIYRISKTSSVGLVLQGRGFHDVSDDKPAMLSLVTDDVDAWYERLVEANVKVLKELPPAGNDWKPGNAPVRGFLVEDPGGYTIEFFSWQNNAGN